LQELARRNQERIGMLCTVETGQSPRRHLQGEKAIQFYRIAQEALHNATKHAKAKHIVLRLTTQDGAWTLTVKDDGVGLPVDAQVASGMGLRIMQYRAHMIGGTLSVRNDSGGGVIVSCSAPELQTD
jgi:signal transduction histidine kinase